MPTQNAHIKYFCQYIVVALSFLVLVGLDAIYFICLMKFGKKAREMVAE